MKFAHFPGSPFYSLYEYLNRGKSPCLYFWNKSLCDRYRLGTLRYFLGRIVQYFIRLRQPIDETKFINTKQTENGKDCGKQHNIIK